MSKEQESYVITGANSFLGEAFAKYLSEKKNSKLFLTSRTKSDYLEKLTSNNIRYFPKIDLTEENDLDNLHNEIDNFISDKFHIINCVGYFPDYKTIQDMNIVEAKKVFDSNILSLYGVAHKLIPLMNKRGGGHFIGFSTHTSYQHYPLMVAFTAAKIAVESLIQGISNEYLEKNIVANAIALATLDTEVERKIKPKGDLSSWLKTEEVCTLVDNLIANSNDLINGNVIHAYRHSKTYFGQSYFGRIEK